MKLRSIVVATALMAAAACAAPQPPTPFAPPETLTVEVVGERPHDPTAYTEGLVASEGLLYESTGLYEQSTLREVDAISGSIRRSLALDDRYFGEGIAVVDDTIIQLTWREHTALVYQLSDFAPIGTYSYETEGWGLCDDGERIAMSDGTSKLYFRNRSTFALLSSVTVASDRAAVDGLNELECVGGDVYANVYQTDTIVRIDPSSGRVTATIDGSSIHPTGHDVGVMNGIAYDKSAGTFLLTGKNWPTMFEVRLVPDE